MPSVTHNKQNLSLQLTGDDKRTLEAAATVSHRSVAEFVLESALTRANEILADRCMFGLSEIRWTAFIAALDAPVRPLLRLTQILTEPGFFDPDQ
jgi:uncharacterized protein (DUF1778 family)